MGSKHGFDEFIKWGFYSLLTGVVIYAATSIGDMARSVQSLAVSVEKHAIILESYNRRLEKLENKREH